MIILGVLCLEMMEEGKLPRRDPVLALAQATFDFPIDINKASYEELIRIPGIGARTAQRICLADGLKGQNRSQKSMARGRPCWASSEAVHQKIP